MMQTAKFDSFNDDPKRKNSIKLSCEAQESACQILQNDESCSSFLEFSEDRIKNYDCKKRTLSGDDQSPL